MSKASQCRVCDEYGCTAKNHKRCGNCGHRGHNRASCSRVVDESSEDEPQYSQLYSTVEETLGMRRASARSIQQYEYDMAARVMAGVDYQRQFGPLNESIVQETMRLTGLGEGKIQDIKSTLEHGQQPMVVDDTRGTWEREIDRDIITKIRNCVGTLNDKGIMSTVAKINYHLAEWHQVNDLSNSQLRRILLRLKFSYTKPGAHMLFFAHEKDGAAEYRLQYLLAIQAARMAGEVSFLDESYINQQHVANQCWVEPSSKVFKPSGKGRRYVIYGAGSRNGWLGKPVVFACKKTEDYHDGMNGDHFMELFEQNCRDATEELGPTTFVMDNAAYHKRYTDERYRIGYWRALSAPLVIQAWEKKEVPGSESYTGERLIHKTKILKFLSKHPPQGVCEVSVIAAKYGHNVLFLPPYHPELNPIETAWGITKNKVATKNRPGVSFDNLRNLTERAIGEVTLKSWAGLDLKVKAEEQKQLKELLDLKRKRDTAHQEFRAVHELIINTADDSDDESDDEVVNAINDGIEGRNARADCPHGGLPPEACNAANILVSLKRKRSSEE